MIFPRATFTPPKETIADVGKAGFIVARVEPADEVIYNKINQELARH